METDTPNQQFELPVGACDCHTHVFGDPQRYPLSPDRSYTPGLAPLGKMRALHSRLGLDHVVIVQPSPYGTNNSCTLDALAELGEAGRGIAVIDPGASDADLGDMHEAGIRGVRLNLATGAPSGIADARARFEAAADRIEGAGWHIQVLAEPEVVLALAEAAERRDVTLVADHFAGLILTPPDDERHSLDLLDRVAKSGLIIKASARIPMADTPGGAKIDRFAEPLIGENPSRIVWGSDWPNPGGGTVKKVPVTQIEPFLDIDHAVALRRLAEWCGSTEVWRQVLVDNPATLYGF